MFVRACSTLLLLGLVACTEIPPAPATGGSGGEGGTGGIAGSGGSAGNGGTGGDAFLCDDGTSGIVDNTVCSTCAGCAAAGPCSTETDRCDTSTLCTAFADCLNLCGEMSGDIEACIDACVSSNPEGASVFEIAQSCQFCECPNNCNYTNACRDVLECDDGTTPSLDEPEVCDACITCAADGPCKTSTDACGASSECDDFINCDIACGNGGGDAETCFETCSETNPAGAGLYRDNATCLCAQCPSNCAAAPACEFY